MEVRIQIGVIYTLINFKKSTGFFVFSVVKVSFGFVPRSALQLAIFSCLWFFLCLISLWVVFNDYSPIVFRWMRTFTWPLVRLFSEAKSILGRMKRRKANTKPGDIELGGQLGTEWDDNETNEGDGPAETLSVITNSHTSRSRRTFHGDD